MYYFITKEGNYYQATENIPMNQTDISISERPSSSHVWNFESSSWVFNNDMALQLIREQRDQLLKDTDKYMLVDFPMTETKRDEWKVYRQTLRDFPTTADLENLVWTTPPS